MRKLAPFLLIVAVLCTAGPASAASATDFYLGLLQRGAAELQAGRNAAAVDPLRLAAFGLLESIEHYETAQAYLTVALSRLGQSDRARESALRIVAAERIERRFATLQLPASIREEFNGVARKVLSTIDAALLTAPPTSATAARTPGAADTPGTTKPAAPQPKPQPQLAEAKVPVIEQKPAVAEQKPLPVEQKPAVPETKPMPAEPEPVIATPKPVPPPVRQPSEPAVRPPAPPAAAPEDVPSRLAAGERALAGSDLDEARRVYRGLLDVANLDHASALRVAEGLYRARDFAGTLRAFERAGPLTSSEEPYRYYLAVALYETGAYAAAKRELATALPHIEPTADVLRYRAKIEGAR